MKSFSIKELERFSGVKAHTIRIWEQRYGIFMPDRTEGNTRMYSLDDVRLLLTIAQLARRGMRISCIARMGPDEMQNKLRLAASEQDRLQMAIAHLIIYKFSGDIERFEEVLDSCVLFWNIETTISLVILPFLEKTELLSYTDKSSEAHFVVTAIRKKIILGIETVKPASFLQRSGLLFLPEGEHYDLMLLITAFVLKREGLRILYLGTNIAPGCLQESIMAHKPDYLFTYVPFRKKFRLHTLLPFLSQLCPRVKMFVLNCDILQEQQRMADTVFLNYRELLPVLQQQVNRATV